MRQEVIDYVEREVLPRYDAFDKGHRRDHADYVIAQAAEDHRASSDHDPRTIYGRIISCRDLMRTIL